MSRPIKWQTILGLVFLVFAIVMDWSWVSGLLFLFWTIPSFYSEVVYFIEPIEKKKDPVLYWIIMVLWLGLSLISFIPGLA